MRVYVSTVFNQVVSSTSGEQFSDADLNGMMASADQISFQMRVRPTSGNPTVTINLYHSNDNKAWVLRKQLMSSIATLGQELVSYNFELGTDPLGGFARLGVALSGTTVADVAVIATGRGDA